MLIGSKATNCLLRLSLPRFKDQITFETCLPNPFHTANLTGGILSIAGTQLYRKYHQRMCTFGG